MEDIKQDTKNEKYIYVVLVKANTGLGKVARLVTDYEYTHTAICLDDKFEEFITFSRRKHFKPFDAGFTVEKLSHYAFGNNESVKLKIFRLPTTNKRYKLILAEILRIKEDPSYTFNFYSMLTMSLLHGLKIDKALNCMSFVAGIVKMTGCVKMNRPYYKYSIEELDYLLTDFFYEEKEFFRENEESDGYMDKTMLVENVTDFATLNLKLLRRIASGKRRSHHD